IDSTPVKRLRTSSSATSGRLSSRPVLGRRRVKPMQSLQTCLILTATALFLVFSDAAPAQDRGRDFDRGSRSRDDDDDRRSFSFRGGDSGSRFGGFGSRDGETSGRWGGFGSRDGDSGSRFGGFGSRDGDSGGRWSGFG